MVVYIIFLIITFLPLAEGDILDLGRFLLLVSLLPISIYLVKKKIEFDKLDLIFIVFLLIATISTIFSPVFSRSFNQLILYFAYFIYFLASRTLTQEKGRSFLELIVFGLLFSSLILCLLSFVLLAANISPAFSAMNLVFANFGHSHLVDLLILVFPISFYLFLTTRGIKKILFLFLSLIYLAGFILSFSRGGWLILIFILGCFGFFLLKKRKFVFLSAIIIILGFSLFTFVHLRGVSIATSEVEGGLRGVPVLPAGRSPPAGGSEVAGSSFGKKLFRQFTMPARIEYFHQTALAIKEKPFSGWGLDNFRYASQKFQSNPSYWSWYSHNHFLQMFAETGILGGSVFLILIFLLIIIVWSNDRTDKRIYKIEKLSLGKALSLGILASCIHSLFDYDWQFKSVFLIFWVIAGSLIKIKNPCLPAGRQKSLAAGRQAKIKKINFFYSILIAISILAFINGILGLWGNIYLLKASEAENNGNIKGAESYFLKSLKTWPFKLESWQAAVNFYHRKGNSDKEADFLNKLIKLEPANFQNYKSLADIYFKREDDQYYAYFLKVIEFSPYELENLYDKLLAFWKGKPAEGREIIGILSKVNKMKGDYCQLKCLGFANEEKILGILSRLEKSSEFDQLPKSDQAKVYYWIALLSTYKNNWDEEIKLLEKAVVFDPRPEYQSFLDDIFKIKRIEEWFLKGDLEKVKSLSDSFPQKEKFFYQKFYISKAFYLLGKMNFERHDLLEAHKYFKLACEVNPWDPQNQTCQSGF